MSHQRKAILLAAGFLLIVFTSATTVVVMKSINDGATATSSGALPSRRFDLFESYDDCERGVRRAVPGHVVSLISDDRAARYDERSNINKLFFLADVANEDGTGVHLEQGVRQIFARCDVSAQTGRISGIYLREENQPEYIEAS